MRSRVQYFGHAGCIARPAVVNDLLKVVVVATQTVIFLGILRNFSNFESVERVEQILETIVKMFRTAKKKGKVEKMA